MPMLIPAPINPAETMRLFKLYKEDKGISSIMGVIDFTGVTRRQLDGAVLGRSPESGANAIDGEKFNARGTMAALLQSDEFQLHIRELILHAFPHKRRKIFVHIPKCAGTDLNAALQRHMPYMHLHFSLRDITSKAQLFDGLRSLVINLDFCPTIAISGHVPLTWYQDRNLVRYEDDIFTVVRDPKAMMYSYIAFLLTRFKTYAGVERNDTRNWLKSINLTIQDVGLDPSPEFLREIGSRLLREPSVTNSNFICNNLGRGKPDVALDNIVRTGIEITDTKRYTAWKQKKFGFSSEKRHNESLPIYTPENAPAEDRKFIEDMVQDDMKVYQQIMQQLEKGDSLSICGTQLG